MKKVLVLVALLFVSISLYAQKPLIKIYNIDGNEKEYNIEDISEINFVKTNKLSTMFVYQPKITHKFLIANINSIILWDKNKLTINMAKLKKTLFIAEIDSILIIPKNCSEVTIINQTWTCKNLDVDHYRNGDSISEVKDPAEWSNLKTGAWCYYNNDPALGAIYGKLYNWYAVNDPRGLAPEGWHVPSNVEWKILINNLGESVAGRKVKSIGILNDGTGLWYDASSNATDDYGFTALPGGARKDNSLFDYISNGVFFWSSDAFDDTRAYEYNIPFRYDDITKDKYNFKYGLSVRCVKGPFCPAPILNSITPDTTDIGDIMIIKGENLCSPQCFSFVSFPYAVPKQADYISWSDTEIKIKVPIGAASGKISVTIYGIKSNEIDFVVKRKIESGSVKDIDGNEYKTLKLGNQWWMESNLKVKHYRNGDPIPEVKDSIDWFKLTTGAWCDYNNEPAMESPYGALYNWFTVNDPRGLAPDGWHVATDAEWNELITSFSGKNVAGSKLKDIGNTYWVKPNDDATNESEFSARPAGQRGYQGIFDYLGYFAYFWTYTEYDDLSAELKRLYYDGGQVGSFNNYKNFGYSVRCVKDAATVILPKINSVSPDPVSMGDILTLSGENFGTKQDTNFVSIYSKKVPDTFYQSWSNTEIKVRMPKGPLESTASVTVNGWKSNDVQFNVVNISNPPKILSISPDSAEIGKYITITGEQFGTTRDDDFVLFDDLKPNLNDYQSWTDNAITVKIPAGVTSCKISVTVYGLKSNDYNYKIKGGIKFDYVTDQDGISTKTVNIGNQWWTAKNLNVSHYRNGDVIPQVIDSTEWATLTTGAWCYYNNDPKNGEIYGKLYNWYAVNDPRGLSPEGWHIPSHNEWTVMTGVLGGEWDGGGKLKSTGTIEDQTGLWHTPNTEARNTRCFWALPGGVRNANSKFDNLEYSTRFWTATAFDESNTWYRRLSYDSGEITTLKGSYKIGFSVRCVKDPDAFPEIISVTADTVSYGDKITIVGKGFGTLQATSFISFDAIQLQQFNYISWNDNEIKIIVPYKATTGKISVNVNGAKSNSIDIFVKSDIQYGTMTDTDGQVYSTVKIGTQWWMAENLNSSHYRNGDVIPEVKESNEWINSKTDAFCYYNNNQENGKLYGKLYNWNSVINSRGLAPEGWHIPSDLEWATLTNFLSVEGEAGGKLKTKGTIEDGDGLWVKPNKGATNEVGFSAKPASCRSNYDGGFENAGYSCYFWTLNEDWPEESFCRIIGYDEIYFALSTINKNYGLSVRCIKDSENTPYVFSLSPDTVAIGEILTIKGRNFGINQANSYVSLNGQKLLQSDYQSLTNNEIKVIVPKGTTSGKSFVCVNEIKSFEFNLIVIKVRYDKVTDIDGKIYKTIKIGDQVWFANNLNVTHYRNGDPIPEVKDSAEWANLKTGAWSYFNNDTVNGAIYGRLYNWFAVNDSRGLAPEGWHIPNDAEWNLLINFAGGTSVAGGKFKELGKVNWISPNTGATDEYGFSALPGGSRKYDGSFYDKRTHAYFWSLSYLNSNGSNYVIAYSSSSVFKNQFDFKHGFSVRCIKD